METEGGGGFEERVGGVVEVEAAGGEFAAGRVVLAEAVEAAAELGGIGGGHFGAPGAGVAGNGAGGGEDIGEDLVIRAAAGLYFEKRRGGRWRGSGAQEGSISRKWQSSR